MVEANSAHRGGVWSDAAARFHAEALAQSDYVAVVGGALRAALGPCPSLLDIGAGCGSLGASLLDRTARWTAIEPNRFMQRALRRRAAAEPDWRLTVLGCRWQDAAPAMLAGHAVVLCANIPGLTPSPTDHPAPLLAHLRTGADRVAWVVPAQAGPRRFCLSGLLPPALHGEDTVPGHERTLAALGPRQAPRSLVLVDWTFRCRFDDLDRARRHLAASYGEPAWDQPGSALDHALRAVLRPSDDGLIAEVEKRSALMLW
ncbi:MAG: class I SAM-dependent methyltransferase [Alphaproteobacteria bacterium]|nr:class I SAM-dependent methyltransferase [Alphaproteobacteria bacterium]